MNRKSKLKRPLFKDIEECERPFSLEGELEFTKAKSVRIKIISDRRRASLRRASAAIPRVRFTDSGLLNAQARQVRLYCDPIFAEPADQAIARALREPIEAHARDCLSHDVKLLLLQVGREKLEAFPHKTEAGFIAAHALTRENAVLLGLLGKRHALAHTLDHDDPRDVVLLRHQQE